MSTPTFGSRVLSRRPMPVPTGRVSALIAERRANRRFRAQERQISRLSGAARAEVVAAARRA